MDRGGRRSEVGLEVGESGLYASTRLALSMVPRWIVRLGPQGAQLHGDVSQHLVACVDRDVEDQREKQ